MFKRLISVILSVFIMMSALSCNVFALDTKSKEQASFEFLTDLGIITSEIESMDNIMSREEFSVYMTNMLKLDIKASANVRYFKDVEFDGYAVDSINALANMGLISVGDDREFRPQDGILTEEASKILVSALGYSEEAEHSGGYPVGYMTVAVRLGILRSVDTTDNTVTYGKAFSMICNAMEAPLLSIEVFNSDGSAKVYDDSEEHSILTKVWELKSVRGMVTATYGSSANTTIIKEKNEIRIDNVLFTLNDGLCADEHFGDYVKAYYQSFEDNNDKIIMSIRNNEKTEKVTVMPENYKGIIGNEISYFNENGREQKIVLAEPVYVYNGYPIRSDISNKLSNINKGEIVIKDGNGDGGYDLVIISDYENFVVSTADTETAYNKLGGTPIVWDDYTNVNIVTSGGIVSTTADVKAGLSLAVARSEGNHIIKAIISDSKNTGSIEACEEIGDIYYVTVDSKSYPIDKSYAVIIKDTYLANISSADSFEFLIDAFGNISYIAKKASALKTGYLIDGDINAETLDSVASIKILTEQNKFEIYDLAESVRINESRYNSSVSAFKNLPGNTTVLDEITVKNQIIRYMLNEDGKVNRILTSSPTAWNGTDDAGFLQLLDRDTEHRYVRGRMGKKITLSASSIVFFIPRGESVLEEEDCGVTNYNILVDDMIYLTNAYLFSEDNIIADAAVCYYTPEQLANNRLYTKPIMIVSSISQRLDSEGNPQHCVTGYSNGGKIEYYVPDEVSIAGIEEGDIIMFTYDFHGNIIQGTGPQDYDILVKCSDIETNGKPTWTNHERYDYLYKNSADAISDYYRAEIQLSFGHVLKTTENAIAFDHELDGTFDEIVQYNGNVVVYDSSRPEKNRVYTAKVADILTFESVGLDCAKIILRTRGQVPLEVFIYQ